MCTNKMKLVKYTPDQYGRRLLRKYLLAICPVLSPHSIAGAITAAGPQVADVIQYLQEKYKVDFSVSPPAKKLRSFYRKGTGPRFNPYAPVDQGETVLLIIDDFIDYDEQMLYEFFLLQETGVFEIVIPRMWENNENLNEAIFYFGAYAGQLLGGQCEFFSYFTPAPRTCEPIRFILTIRDTVEFTKIFRRVIAAFFQSGTPELTSIFMQEASDFIERCYGNVSRCFTWGLVEQAMMLNRGYL